MNKEKIPKIPTLLLLVLLFLSCGLLLIHTVDKNMAGNGFKGLKEKQSEQKAFYDAAH